MAGKFSRPADRSVERQRARMSWRAAGAQFYPGGAYDVLHELSHRGQGPKGERTSDEQMREAICERLMGDPFIDASQVSIDVSGGEVTLQGAVQVQQQKYAIEDLVAQVPGVTEVHNRLRVGSEEVERRTSGL